MSARRKVVITGCGVVSAAGNDLEGFWNALMAGTTLIGPLKNYSAPEMDILWGGEATLDGEDAVPSGGTTMARRERCDLLALAACRRALDHAGLLGNAEKLADAGVVIGTTVGEERQVGELSERWPAEGREALDAGFFDRVDNHRLAASLATRFGMGGPVLLNATACSSGNAAVAWAFDLVAGGQCDVVVAGGTDTFTRLLYNGFSRMSALSKGACKPFDKNRDGVSFGEGAGVVVVESLDHARTRGVRVLAEIRGYGISNDAHHVTAPEPNGAGYVRAIRQALATSATDPARVGYVSAHGTGTPYNDQGEVRAIKAVFGDRANAIPISSIKSIIGHTNGAAGAIATIACVLALVHQKVPPTAGLVEPDPEFGLDFVVGQGRPVTLDTCLNISAGFGGMNACLLLASAP